MKDLDPFLFQYYTEYLLGEHVWGLEAKRADGSRAGGPSWTLLLSYEHEMRQHAYSAVCNEGKTLKEALTAAMNSPIIKDRYFTTPLSMESRPPAGREVQREVHHQQHQSADSQSLKNALNVIKKLKKENSKGKGSKGKGSKGKGKGKVCASRTPDERDVCYDYNERTCTKNPCRLAHVCGICFKEGVSMWRCDHA